MLTAPRTGAARAAAVAGAVTLVAAALVALQGCAHVALPPGGPPDSVAPLLIAVEPESLSVVPGFDGEVRFEFDEPISERNIQSSVVLFPFEPRPKIKKGKRELKVKPREGWMDNRIYHVRVEPVVQDLFNNVIEQPILFTFSTGLVIPENFVTGTVFDRISGRPLAQGRVDMVQLPDTLRYGVVADTAGSFAIANLPTGDYLAIGYEDANGNRKADRFDRADTIRVSVDAEETLDLEFDVFRHDTIGPLLALAQPLDSTTVELEFDGYLDPDVPLSTADVQIFAREDSSLLAIDTVLHAWEYPIWRDSVRAAQQARRDSLAALEAAQDTAAAGAQPQVPEPEAPPAEAEQPPADAQQPPAEAEVPAEAQEAQARAEQAEEPLRLPDRRIYVVAAGPIPAGTHVVVARGIVNLSGLAGGGEADFEPLAPTPEEQPPEQPPPEPQQQMER